MFLWLLRREQVFAVSNRFRTVRHFDLRLKYNDTSSTVFFLPEVMHEASKAS